MVTKINYISFKEVLMYNIKENFIKVFQTITLQISSNTCIIDK